MNDCYQRLNLSEQRSKRTAFQHDENFNILAAAFDRCKCVHGLTATEIWDEVMTLRECLTSSVRKDLEIRNYPEELCERYRYIKDSDGIIYERTEEEARNTAFFVVHGLVMCLVAKEKVNKNPYKDLIFILLDFTTQHPFHDDFVQIQRECEDNEEKKGYHYIVMDYLSSTTNIDLTKSQSDSEKADILRNMSEQERNLLAFAQAVNRIQENPISSADVKIRKIQEWGVIQRCAYALHFISKENDNAGFLEMLSKMDIKYILGKPSSTHLSKFSNIVDIERKDNKIHWNKHVDADEQKFHRSKEIWCTFYKYFKEIREEQKKLISQNI